MGHRIAIQLIRIAWTQALRGAEAGAVRNALPRTAPFRPPHDSDQGWLHRIDHDALNSADYQFSEQWLDLSQTESWRLPVKTRVDDDHLWIATNVHLQKPNRLDLRGWIVRLPFGQRAIIRVNTAADGHHPRFYFEYHISIGFAEAATLGLPLFREVDERALLY